MSRTGRLRSAGLELLAVVAGILIAFSLDAWWDGEVEARRASQQLAELGRQVDGDLEHLDLLREDVQSIAHRLDMLESLLPAEPTRVVIADSLLGATIRWRTSDVSTSSFDAFVDGGLLSTIDDLELRRMISSFPAVLEDLQEDERLAQNYVETVFGPFLAEHGMGRIAYANRNGEDMSTGASEVLVPASFTGMLAARQTHLAFIILTMDGVEDFLVDMRGRIDGELAR
jgi:hypothetical protein